MSRTIPDDDSLIRSVQAGDEAALGEIIEKYTPYVGTIVWHILAGTLKREDAAEVVSQVFYLLWQNRAKLRQGKLKPYLGSMARSKAVDALRRAKQESSLEDDEIDSPIEGPEEELIRAEEYRALRRTVDHLPEPDRTIFVEHYYFYQTTGAIASKMGLNVKTVQTKLRRGRESLRRALEGGDPLEETNL